MHAGGESEFFYDKDSYEKRVAELGGQTEQGEGNGEEAFRAEELHEVMRLNKIDKGLQKDWSLSLKDFLLRPRRAVSGEALETKFEVVCAGEKNNVASLDGICPTIRMLGGRDIEIKRFKGLGEMNSEQLWNTTMNPQSRTLLQVKLEDAGEADRLFSILMGDNVDQRRNFIREHALEVQNLDV